MAHSYINTLPESEAHDCFECDEPLTEFGIDPKNGWPIFFCDNRQCDRYSLLVTIAV